MTSSKDLIRNTLTAHILENLGCAVVCPSKEIVTQFPVDGHLFGWFPPMPLADENSDLLIVSFCPELMAEITEWLTDDQLLMYLATIEALLSGYCDALQKGTSSEAARERVESEIFDASPEALTLFTEVEMRALDAGIVPKRI